MSTKWTKALVLKHWQTLADDKNPLAHMTPIPYKAEGSTFGTCGVRIMGNPRFIDAVLGHLKQLIDGENNVTRLGLPRSPVKGDFKSCPNADEGAESCYIQLHMRSAQGSHVSAFFDKHLHSATEKFAEVTGT